MGLEEINALNDMELIEQIKKPKKGDTILRTDRYKHKCGKEYSRLFYYIRHAKKCKDKEDL